MQNKDKKKDCEYCLRWRTGERDLRECLSEEVTFEQQMSGHGSASGREGGSLCQEKVSAFQTLPLGSHL